MVNILDGNSVIVAQIWSNFYYLIGLRQLIKSRAVTNRIYFFLHACATCSKLLLSISTTDPNDKVVKFCGDPDPNYSEIYLIRIRINIDHEICTKYLEDLGKPYIFYIFFLPIQKKFSLHKKIYRVSKTLNLEWAAVILQADGFHNFQMSRDGGDTDSENSIKLNDRYQATGAYSGYFTKF